MLLEEAVAALRQALAAALRTPRLSPDREEDEPPFPSSPLCARVAGFTLHAAQSVEAADRAGLERFCRYGLRAPFSQERLTRREDGRLVYHLRRPWPRAGGVRSLVLEREDLLRRVFFVEALRCPRCATALVVLAIRPEDRGLDELPFVDEARPEHDPHAYDGNDVPEVSAADADDEAPP